MGLITLPSFNFSTPKAYEWSLEKAIIGFNESSRLYPWYYLDNAGVFSVTDRWPLTGHLNSASLIAFVRRYDNDDIACFSVVSGNVEGITTIHGWTPEGYTLEREYQTFWGWLKSVIDDIAEVQ